jgi:hypothetical protein
MNTFPDNQVIHDLAISFSSCLTGNMTPIGSYDRLRLYLAFRGSEGVTSDLEALTQKCGLKKTDISLGDVIGYCWRSSIGEIIDLYAVTTDGHNYDFSLNLLVNIRTDEFNYGFQRKEI